MAAPASPTPGGDARGFSFELIERDGELQLLARHHPKFSPLRLDWFGPAMKRRIAGGRRQLLARATGLNKTADRLVLDATAGLGRDAFTLAALGARVVLVERQPLLLALLRDAHARALADPAWSSVAARLSILEGDAEAVLTGGDMWDVVHLDPMYPHRSKDALPQKEMQILRELCGADTDADHLLEPSLAACRRRVVVKRPLHAPHLDARTPDYRLVGTQARYDVYVPAAQSAR